ncbi:MAG TPA: glycosyltransferase family 4 protein [Bryobacteraceae bacterium]|nr:glycosyltransferase family 4 protein [Bryobacteraceae bacterium]
MRIGVHDFAGHPFQVQLSRELAASGHKVCHWYLHDLPGPKGPLEPSVHDPATFRCRPLSLGQPFDKYSFIKRHFLHRRYARLLAAQIRSFRPDVVLSANTPIDVQHDLLKACRRGESAFVHWMQDLYCRAVRSVVTQKLGRCGAPLAHYYDRLERHVCERSDSVVFITPDFMAAVRQMGFRPARSHVIENWAPLDDVKAAAKLNPWSQKNGLADRLVFLYSGTLGLKHKPELLYRLAEALRDVPEAVVVVVSEGLGRQYLEDMQVRSGLHNLILMDFQPYRDVSDVLGAADVLLAIIDNEAGSFAVPSKVLSYLCAGRPILLAAPRANLSSRTVVHAEAGITVRPEDEGELVNSARRLASDPGLRAMFAENARRYATTAFDIHAICRRFEAVLEEAAQSAAGRSLAHTYESYPRVATD